MGHGKGEGTKPTDQKIHRWEKERLTIDVTDKKRESHVGISRVILTFVPK